MTSHHHYLIRAVKSLVATALFLICIPSVSFAATIEKVDPRAYSQKVSELDAVCKAKNSPNWTGFCLTRSYGPVSLADTGQTSMTLGLQAASLELVYRSCEHSDFPSVNNILSKAKAIFETQKFFDEIKPQDEALKNYVGRFSSCQSKSENDTAIANRLQWFEYMIQKYSVMDAQPPAEAGLPKSIWLVKQLSCNGVTAHQMTRSPDAAEIGRTGIVKIPNLQMEFIVPSIPELAVRTVKLAFDDRGRNVVDHYVLLARNDFDDPVAAVMVTELPPSVDTPQQALGAAMAGERGNLQGTLAQPTLERISTSWGEGLDIFVPNRIGSPCFPAARFKLTADSETKPTISLSRFITMPGRLIQFALILPVTPGTALEAQKANARRVMEIYAAGLRAR